MTTFNESANNVSLIKSKLIDSIITFHSINLYIIATDCCVTYKKRNNYETLFIIYNRKKLKITQ